MKKYLCIILVFVTIGQLHGQVSGILQTSMNNLVFSQEKGYTRVKLSYPLPTKIFITTQGLFGEPEVPVVQQKYLVPINADSIVIQLLNASSQRLSGTFLLYPEQPPVPVDYTEPPAWVEPDSLIYQSSSPYPSKRVEITNVESIFGYQVITVNIYPLSYTPNIRRLDLFTSISFRIQYSLNLPVTRPLKISDTRDAVTKSLIRGMILNPADIGIFAGGAEQIISYSDGEPLNLTPWPFSDGDIPDLVIITSEEYRQNFETFAQWKTKMGVPALVVTTEEINQKYVGVDQAERIFYYLKDVYNFWGSTYIVLGGDIDIIPARYAYYCDDLQEWRPCELYYSDVFKIDSSGYNWNGNGNTQFGEDSDGLDLGADHFVGRIPFNSAQELDSILSKTQAYTAADVPDSTYYNNLLFLTGYLETSNGVPTCTFASNLDILSGNIQSNNQDITRWRVFDDPVPPDVYGVDEIFNRKNTLDNLDHGGSLAQRKFHLVYHQDHSGPTRMGTSTQVAHQAIYRQDVDTLKNKPYYQIFYTGGCNVNSFDYDDAISEHYYSRGAVGFIGGTASLWGGDEGNFEKFCQTLYIDKTGTQIGPLLEAANSYHPETNYKKRIALLGDPSLHIWTKTPAPFSVSVTPDTIITGKDTITLTIQSFENGKKAYLCVYKANEVYVRDSIIGMGMENVIIKNIICNAHTTGQLSISLTSQNYKPYQSSIDVINNPGVNLFVESFTFDDDSLGNKNGQLEEGEKTEFEVKIRNSGLTDAQGVNASLTTFTWNIVIVQPISNFGNIPGLSTGISNPEFIIQAWHPQVDYSLQKLELRINDQAGNNFQDTILLQIHQINPTIILDSITTNINNDNIIDPGDTVSLNITLKNSGSGEAINVTGSLWHNSPFIQAFIDSTQSFGDLMAFGIAKNIQPFKFKVSPTYPGGRISLTLTLTTPTTHAGQWSLNFNLDRPDSITSLDYRNTISTISTFWNPIINSAIKGYNVYRSDSLAGPYIKLNPLPIEGFSGYTDDGLPELSTYYYKVCAVRLYGVEGPFTAPLKAWTSLPFHPGFPITDIDVDLLGHKSDGSPMTYDIDNNGDKEIFVNLCDQEGDKGTLFGFYQNGEEIYDIDTNSNTISGFYKYSNAGSRSVPAIADIDLDGKPEIMNVTIGNDLVNDKRKLFVHHTFDHDNNNIPDLYWRDEAGNFQTMGAVIADLNGDFFPEIITKANYGAPIYVYSKDGTNYPGWPKIIESAGGNVIPVATDLDKDGNKEIIFGFGNGTNFNGGIYAFRHNGAPYITGDSLLYKNGPNGPTGGVYDNMDSPVSAADVNGDGYPELICVSGRYADDTSKARVFVLDRTGNTIPGWGYNETNHIISITDLNVGSIMWLPLTSVADINKDLHPEIFTADKDTIYAWNADGTALNNHFPLFVPGLSGKLVAPLIADVDGDNESEIVVLSNSAGANSAIHAYNADGSKALGWPLRVPGANFFATPCIDDIDQDRKNEIIATSGSKIYVWDCEGSADELLWGKYRLNSYNNADLEDPCTYSSTPYNISAEKTWSNDVRMHSDLIIQPGATLTVRGNLFMPSEAKIIIKPSSNPVKIAGGKLIVDGGRITTSCRDSLWMGIEVWGLPGYSQTAHTASGKLIQGQVSVIHNGSVRYAKTGILASKAGFRGYAGGIISADSATFENNKVAIQYDPYSFYNYSRFKRCNFITTDTLRDGSFPNSFVRLNGVNPVVFEGCTFKNTLLFHDNINGGRGVGIYSENSGYYITAACLDPNSSPCTHLRYSSFEKLYRGIYSMNSGSSSSIHIADANFLDNYNGLYLSGFNGISYAEVISNKFRNSLPNQWSYGMYLNECSGYHVENNEFFDTTTTPVTIGLIVNNSGTLSNEIYRNVFHNLKHATLSQNVNRNYNPPLNLGGLCYKCNKFVKDDLTEPNIFDFSITYEGHYSNTTGIAKNQGTYLSGTSFAPVGNMFQPTPASDHYDFYNEGNPIDYYYHLQNGGFFRLIPRPQNIYGVVNSIGVNEPFTERSCPSTLGGEISGIEINKLMRAKNQSDSIGGVLNALVDGGSTTLLNFDVETSTPPQALQTRDKLMAESPYLSDTVIKTSITKENVLNNAMIRDVLVANPHSAKSDEIISMLETRANPMPDYMMEQILVGEDTVSEMEILEAKKAWWDGEATKAYTRLLNYFKGDSLIPANEDSLNWLFSYRNTLESQYDKVSWLRAKGAYEQADSLLTSIPISFNFTPFQSETHNAFTDFYKLSEQICCDTNGVFNVDSTVATSLLAIATSNSGIPGAYARNILMTAGKISYQEPILLPDTSLKQEKKKKFRGVKESNSASILTVYPNPANDYFVIKIKLDKFTGQGLINLYDGNGKIVQSHSFTGKQDQIIVATANLKTGLYLLILEVEGKRLDSVKIAVIK
ncbi:MAG: C25 family cysteine peptidase [Bacteroidales bacterium]|jgi:hypothetical protein|nr:C25 family cysteine peptidase [Bacteroidales bacterium]